MRLFIPKNSEFGRGMLPDETISGLTIGNQEKIPIFASHFSN
jgi:hypothetical protein